MITITDQSTRRTFMNSHGERLANFCPTKTSLTGSSWINFHEHAPGALSLVREIKEKVGPTSIVHRLGEHAARKSLYVQILDSNKTVGVHDATRGFVMEIPALIANVVVKASQQEGGFASTIRSLGPPRHTALQAPEFSLRISEPARVFDLRSVAQGCERSKANVNADPVRTERQRLMLALNHKDSEPASGLPLHGERLDRAIERAVQFNPYIPKFRQAQSISVNRTPDLPKTNTVVAINGTKARITNLAAGSCAAKEQTKRQVNTVKRVFKSGGGDGSHIITPLTNIFQLQVLLKPRDGFALEFPRITPLLKCGIVQLTADRKLPVQCSDLLFSGINAEAERPEHGPILARGFSF